MKRKLLFAALFVAGVLGGGNLLYAQGTWTAPAAPGEDLASLAEDKDVYIYNIEADAIFARGFNWLTMAIADRPEGGDNAAGAARQRVQIRRDGNNIKIHFNDRGSDVFFGQADNTDPGQMWTDLGGAGNRVVFTPAASANYPNAYTLTNVQHNQKVDVLWGRGGKLTLWNGQGYYDWAFITGESLSAGLLPKFKVRKAMWNLYQALENAGAVSANAEALATANAVYTNESATTDELRSAFRSMFLAVANSIDEPVDVSYIFTHPDMAGDKTAAGWSYTDFAFSAGECEKYHATFASTQTLTDVPNGIYDVAFTGIYRQDDGQNQTAPQLVVSDGTSEWTASFPNMEDLGGLWNIGGNETGDWVNSSTGKKPKWMWSASDAQSLDDAQAFLESVSIRDHTLGVTFKVTGGNQWFNFQRLIVTYKGPISNQALYNSLQLKISEAETFISENTGVIVQSFLDAVSDELTAVSGLTASSDEDALTDGTNNLSAALEAAKLAPTISNINLLSATITLASADGADVTSANSVVSTATTNQQITDALNSLRIARRIANAETHADVFAGNQADAGDFYIYNVGQRRFLCGGDDWGAHAALGFPGIIVTLESDGENFHLDTHLPNGDSSEYLNYNGYCDTSKGDTWTFVEVSTGIYNIARSNNNGQLLGYATGTYNRVNTDMSGASDPNNQWKLVTKAERDALIDDADAEHPVDVSYLIKSPGFSQREDISAWTMTGDAEIWGRGANHPDFAIEAYDKTSAGVEQTLSGLRPGTYELKVQAFYRDGNFNTQVNILANGGEARRVATLYAGTKSSLIQNVSVGADKVPGVARASAVGYMPDGIDDACLYFQNGLYWATLDEIVVGQDGTMTIGARKTEKPNGGDWMVLDNFRLLYKGAGVDLSGVKADLLAKISEANSLLNTIGLDLAFLQDAADNGQTAYDNSQDADVIVEATLALQTAINQANAVDFSVFKQTAAKATAEGVSANDYVAAVENVTDGSTLTDVVAEQLYLLRSDRKINALRMPDIYTGSAPAAGKVYLFNIGTGMFLGAGSDWNTHAAVDQVGIEVELEASGDDFILKSAWGSFNNSPYVDTGANTVYKFQAVAGKENVYNILEGTDLLGWNPNGKTDGKKYWNSISNVTGANAADPNYQWKVITPAERKALLTQATAQNPVDVSYLINNPSHNRKAGYEMYTKDAPGGNGGARVSSQDDNNGDRAADFGYEFWNVDNLEWCDCSYNVRYSLHNRKKVAHRRCFGRVGKNTLKKVAQISANGSVVRIWNNAREVFLTTGMSDWSISECCRGNRKTAYGYCWQYAN